MSMNINWYPGHMKKTADSIKANINKVDVVLELIDARAPIASENPMIPGLIGNKPRVLIFNKGDLADPVENRKWLQHYKDLGIKAVPINANQGQGITQLLDAVDETMSERRSREKEKGIVSELTRAMIIGIPNVGKSTLINSLANKKSTKVGNRPGITTTNQWIRVENRLLLLDTPGVLWPKFQSEELALNLVYIGSIRDDIVVKEDVCLKLIEKLSAEYPKLLEKRYGIEIQETPLATMEAIAIKRGAIFRGNEIDYRRVSDIVMDEFKKGIIGNITLERL